MAGAMCTLPSLTLPTSKPGIGKDAANCSTLSRISAILGSASTTLHEKKQGPSMHAELEAQQVKSGLLNSLSWQGRAYWVFEDRFSAQDGASN